MNEVIADSLARRRFSMILLNAFAVVALCWQASVFTVSFLIWSASRHRDSVSASALVRNAGRTAACADSRPENDAGRRDAGTARGNGFEPVWLAGLCSTA